MQTAARLAKIKPPRAQHRPAIEYEWPGRELLLQHKRLGNAFVTSCRPRQHHAPCVSGWGNLPAHHRSFMTNVQN
ncbi:hypothetical protein X942_5957 [Burkholderia pseudomallei MSHR5596]|nr:hypothetical protein X942_5957 [Burkholderia pseudomallei MSHR5596]